MFRFDLQRFTTITADPSTVTLVKRNGNINPTTFSVTATPSHDGVLSYSIIGSSPSWCTLSDTNIVTVAPPSTVEGDEYNCIIRVTEIYGDLRPDIYLPDNIPSKSIWGRGVILVSKHKKMKFLNQETDVVIATIYIIQTPTIPES